MKDDRKTKAELLAELAELRRQMDDRKSAEDALRLAQEKYTAAFYLSPVALLFSDVKTARIIEVNEVFTTLTGYSKDEAVGRTTLDLGLWHRPADRQRLLAAVLETGECIGLESQLRCRDGSIRDGRASSKIITTAGVPHQLTVIEDLMEIRRQEARFAAMIEKSSDVFTILDAAGVFRYNSPSAETVFGYPREDLIGTSAIDRIHPDDLPATIAAFGTAVNRTNTGIPTEFRFRKGDGSWIVLEVLASNYLDEPDINGIVITSRDITERRKAEAALKASEIRYQSIIENTGTVIVIVEEDMTISFANAQFMKLTGYSRDEVEGKKKWTDFVEKTDLERMVAQHRLRRRNESAASRNYEFVLVRKDGTLRDIDLTVCLIPGTNRTVASMLDITERKRADNELRESERRYRQLIDQAADGIFLVSPQGDFLLVNRKFCEMLGYTEAELLRLNVVDTYPEELRELARSRIKRVNDGENMTFERPVKRKDGSTFLAELSVIRLENRKIQGIIHDITERKKAEEELRRLSIAIEQAAEDIIITDTEGVIQYVNPAFEKITGYTRQEAIGHTPRLLKSGVHGPAFYEHLWNTVTNGEIWSGRITNRRKDGKLIQEDATISPLLNSAGGLTGYVSLKRDITEAVKIEAQLRQTQKLEAIGTLAGGIAHDFNNMLAAMMGYVELAKYKTTDIKIQPYMEQVLKACDRAKGLVAQILTFSRQHEQEKKPVEIAAVVKEALKLLRSSLPSTIEIRQNYAGGHDTALADPVQIHQVIMNLCTNAAYAMRDGEGVLEVSLEQREILPGYPAYDPGLKPGSYLRITVRDNGEGIDPGIKDKIFDPFFTTKKPGEGTGLGLSVVYGIVRDHGGSIAVKSRRGEGTTFTILLPLIDAVADRDGQESAAIPGGSGCILLVDDEEAIAFLGEEMLAALGYDVAVRFSSRDALEAFRDHPGRYDLVITDMTMPNMTGAVLAQEMLKIRPGLPIIMTTGFSERIDEEEAKKIGIREFIMKPVSLPVLAQAVKKIMDEAAERRKEGQA